MHDPARRLMLFGIAARCPDCGAERILVPVEDPHERLPLLGEAYCCTDCDAAVLLGGVILAALAAA